MQNAIKIVIPIEPKAQMRARHAVRGKHAMAYKCKEQREAEDVLKVFLMRNQPQLPFSGPLSFGVRAYLPIPKSKAKKWQSDARAGRCRPTTKPDMDNLLKHLKDCLTQMRYWEDDKQVVEYMAGTGKYYSDQPRWEVEIRPWVPDGGLL
jgi:Holliday junction resolvase RusA-like endonuclease